MGDSKDEYGEKDRTQRIEAVQIPKAFRKERKKKYLGTEIQGLRHDPSGTCLARGN